MQAAIPALNRNRPKHSWSHVLSPSLATPLEILSLPSLQPGQFASA